jgi:hypothetical protein
MKFRLTYQGELKAAGNNSNRSLEKWLLRKAFHPQLAELWQTHPILREAQNDEEKGEIKFPAYESIRVGGKRFIPLIRKSLSLACNLNITFLRKEEPGTLLLQGGDLDNRIKVLFDGLRMPSQSELDGTNLGAEPFYSLLEQDSLITGFSVDTDRLLTRPGALVHQVHLIIEVTVRVMRASLDNIEFLAE